MSLKDVIDGEFNYQTKVTPMDFVLTFYTSISINYDIWEKIFKA